MINHTQIRGVIWLKLWMTLAVSVMLAVVFDTRVALSGLTGGAIACLGSLVYALTAYRKNSYVAPIVLMRRHFLAESIKMGLTACAFALTFIFFPQIAAVALFVGYIVATMAYPLSLIFKFGNKK